MPILEFLHPLFLCALMVLPVLWWWLRTVPPPPKREILPTAKFLHDLPTTDLTVARTPWWLLLLRMMMLACVIIGLSGPRLSWQTGTDQQHKNMMLVIDNSWAAQSIWQQQLKTAHDLLIQAEGQNAAITLAILAPAEGQEKISWRSPITPREAREIIDAATPQAWNADYDDFIDYLNKADFKSTMSIHWLGSGFDTPNLDIALQAAQKIGSVTFYTPEKLSNPLRLTRDRNAAEGVMAFNIELPQPRDIDTTTQLILSDDQGKILLQRPVTIPAGKISANLAIISQDMPQFAPQTARLLTSMNAVSTVLFDGLTARRHVGIVIPTATTDGSPLNRAGYYLERALQPYATITISSLSESISAKSDIIIAPDFITPETAQSEQLRTWIAQGGVFLRFAGPESLKQAPDEFLPVPLVGGARAMSGLANWAAPPVLSPFPATSPLFGLMTPNDLNIRRQALAEPGQDFTPVAWANLSDGTPLITARAIDKGWIVFVHTTADPSWSDLPLSGFYVSFLKRVLTLAGQHGDISPVAGAAGIYDPVITITANGTLRPPGLRLNGINIDSFTNKTPDALHPPGLYQQRGQTIALNLSEHLSMFRAFYPPVGVTSSTYHTDNTVVNLRDPLLIVALILLLLDGLALLWLQGVRINLRPAGAVALIFFCWLQPAHAANDIDAVHLAYVITGNPARDDLSRRGLESLTRFIKLRTAIIMNDVVGVAPDNRNIGLYPVIYWPLAGDEPPLTPAERNNLQDYLRHGGMIFFDTNDRSLVNPPVITPAWRSLQNHLDQLGSSTLQPLPAEHVLGRSFYLLDQFPATLTGGTIWLQIDTGDDHDGVSSIIAGSHGWAQSWAEPIPSGQIMGAMPNQELSFRFGINLLMYALTGNYKTDQVHLPFLLQRLNGRTFPLQELPTP
jgi:hypothetical protein